MGVLCRLDRRYLAFSTTLPIPRTLRYNKNRRSIPTPATTSYALRVTRYVHPMPIPTNVFRNILRLEEHKGFADASVQGGLAAFARRWSEQIVGAERGARAMSEAIA